MKRKRLNVTRKRGRLYFRRETSWLHDHTPDGETLWIMNSNKKPRKVIFVSSNKTMGKLAVHLGTWRLFNAVQAAKAIREELVP